MLEIFLDEKKPRFAFSQRLDATNYEGINEEVKSALATIQSDIVLDVSELTYISSAGLQVILFCAKDMNSKNKKAYLYGAKNDVLEIFQISGFLSFLNKIDSLDELAAS